MDKTKIEFDGIAINESRNMKRKSTKHDKLENLVFRCWHYFSHSQSSFPIT